MTLAVQEESHLTPFLFALKTSETKRQYSRNLKLFFDFGIDTSLSLSHQANIFAKKALNDSNWATYYFMQFFQFQVENRLKTTNEIVAGTVRNYYKAANPSNASKRSPSVDICKTKYFIIDLLS